MSKYQINVVSLLYDYEDYEAADDLVAGYIIAMLRKEGHSTSLNEISRGCEDEDLVKLMQNMPDVVVFTIPRTSNIPELVSFSRYVKSKKPECKIVLAGWSHHSAPMNTELIMEQCSDIDVIIRGEGENTVTELVDLFIKNENLSSCLGITYRDNGRIIANDDRPLGSLDELPFPARDSQLLHNYSSMWISSARGCLGNCAFCAIPATRTKNDPVWRGRSPENVVEELKYLNNTYNIKQFNFLDPTFEDPGHKGKERIRKIAELILESDLDITFLAHMRAENWSEDDSELMELLYLAGLESVLVGVEAGNNSSLQLFNKRAKVENYFSFVDLTSKFNINIDCGFIMFHPYSTFEDLTANADFLKRIGLADTLCTYSSKLYLFPNTRIYQKLQEDNMLLNQGEGIYTLYDYKFLDERVKRLSDKMLTVNTVLSEKAFFHFKGITKLVTYISRMRRRLLKSSVLGHEYLSDNLSILEEAVRDMRKDIDDLNHTWFLKCIDWVKNDGSDNEFSEILKDHLLKIEEKIYKVQKIQLKYGMSIQRSLKI
ncbi:radical SAM protein [Clostridium sp. BNL1100]|uniref:B12-binding domain-containing radical SAM protein n=1 Tax=Clostridium sp. BNL1100 TaxID=755731 RepID=UPI00024A7730|nr:radical SAM protein [Clostridium sp. BNL1100]AEY67362.1 Fe-S oxidoreductase [Clostridium sp. BNL1100]